MNGPLPITITKLARSLIREAEDWWRLNRTAAPNAVREELERVFPIIAAQPQIGGRAGNVKLQNVRRIHLQRVTYDLYYHVIEAPLSLEVVALWHARRGKGPPI
jgi:plasmid stabilization system protein ParE